MKRLAACVFCALLTNCVTSAAPTPGVEAAAPSVVGTQSSDATFRGTKTEIIHLAIRAIQSKGWKLDQVNENVGIVSFETQISWGSWSGISANLIIEEAGPSLYRVTGTAKQNLRGKQLVAPDIAGESQGVVRDALAAMRSLQQPKT